MSNIKYFYLQNLVQNRLVNYEHSGGMLTASILTNRLTNTPEDRLRQTIILPTNTNPKVVRTSQNVDNYVKNLSEHFFFTKANIILSICVSISVHIFRGHNIRIGLRIT